MIVTRFAPSPTGRLHLGHAASALFAAEKAGPEGRFLLRIEDIDPQRCKNEFVGGIFEDLAWLGLSWETPVRRQSKHLDFYQNALHKLDEKGLIYPCFCTRKEIEEETGRALSAPHEAPDGSRLYPGTCRNLTNEQKADFLQKRPAVWRLDMQKAVSSTGTLSWEEEGKGRLEAHPEAFGDIVLARKDVPASYHLCVVCDDALQGVTLVTRGQDLFDATALHRLLQSLLDLPAPRYAHHPLLCDANGKRLAKRDHAQTLQTLRQAGHSPAEVRAMAKTNHAHPASRCSENDGR